MSALIPTQINNSIDFTAGVLLLINKPLEWTSFDVVKKIRNLITEKTNIKKIKVGHAGTLDPLATGLLIICTGKLTKQINTIQNQEKQYIGEISLGACTPSFDRETKISNTFSIKHINRKLLHNTTKKFTGEIWQKPPIFSALKKKGERFYNLARNKEEIEIAKRKVFIRHFEIIDIEMPKISFKISCSKGTYIRSLANDYGQALNSFGYLSKLCRTKIGDYDLNKAMEIEDFAGKINLL